MVRFIFIGSWSISYGYGVTLGCFDFFDDYSCFQMKQGTKAWGLDLIELDKIEEDVAIRDTYSPYRIRAC